MDSEDPGDAELFSLLYVSEMDRPSADEVARICERSRANNLRDAITGLLLFDGKAFCQYVEGSETAIADLLGRLERDPRHLKMRVLQFGAAGGGRRFPSWRLGYAFSAEPAAIERVSSQRGDAAVDAFGRWARDIPALKLGDG